MLYISPMACIMLVFLVFILFLLTKKYKDWGWYQAFMGDSLTDPDKKKAKRFNNLFLLEMCMPVLAGIGFLLFTLLNLAFHWLSQIII